MTTTVKISFLPLTDSAALVAAREQGFAQEEGIDLDLVRSTSWATLRDPEVRKRIPIKVPALRRPEITVRGPEGTAGPWRVLRPVPPSGRIPT